MKNLILLAFILISSSAMAGKIQEENKVLKCMMKILPSHKLNQQMLLNLTSILKKLGKVPVVELRIACENEKNISEELPRLNRHEIEELLIQYRKTQDGPTSPNWKYYYKISSAVVPSFWCKMFGVHVDVGVGVAIGAGVAAGKCTSSTSREFIVFSPQLNAGLGLGAFAAFEPFDGPIIFETAHRINYNQTVHNDETQILVGLGPAIGTPTGDPELSQVGVGVGFIVEKELRLILKLAPTGYDFSGLRKSLGLD